MGGRTRVTDNFHRDKISSFFFLLIVETNRTTTKYWWNVLLIVNYTQKFSFLIVKEIVTF